MSCISSTVKAEKEAELARYVALLAKAEAALTAVYESSIKSYRFDSAEGSQATTHLDTDKLQKDIGFFQSRINRLRGELRGTAIMITNIRRRH